MRAFFVGSEAFLPHPCGIRGHYIRTHPCVLFVACPYCDAAIGECCVGRTGPRGMTHYKRRDAYTALRKHLKSGVVTLEVS